MRLYPEVERRAGRLVGGDPTTVLRLRPAAARRLCDGGVTVTDAAAAAVARALLRTRMGFPDLPAGPGSGAGPHTAADVTVVVPVKDDAAGVWRLLAALDADDPAGVIAVVLVDDGSVPALQFPEVTCAAGSGRRVRVLRHETPRGPAAARNAGAALAETDLVAFLDADIAPCAGWLDALLPHLADERVVMVAPRILAPMGGGEGGPCRSGGLRALVECYERYASALDMGPRPAGVAPGTRLTYVPSAALVLRRAAFPGFDEALHVAEDVDLCWRVVAAGHDVRYEPRAGVVHRHRVEPCAWLRRRAFYGTGAAPLGKRHGRHVAPAVLPVWAAVAVGGLVWARPAGLAVATGAIGWAWWRTRGLLGDGALAARLVARGAGAGLAQVASTSVRTHWPLTVPFAVVSRHWRRRLSVLAALDAGRAHRGRRVPAVGRPAGAGTAPRVEPARPGLVALAGFAVLHGAADLAYGLGVWRSAWTARSPRALLPVVWW